MKVLYSGDYFAPIGVDHVFPMQKFELIHRTLLAEGTISATDVVKPQAASDEELGLVHSSEYLQRLDSGQLSEKELRALGLPWSEQLIIRSRTAAQGTLMAARIAMREGVGCNIGGGTHHAFPDRGEGFCVLNDVAIAIRCLQRDGWIRRAMVVDLDVHQGNGTASIFSGDNSVFTYSVHGQSNYPLRKVPGDFDLGLADGTSDLEYLSVAKESLTDAFDRFRPEIVLYLAGADPYRHDILGKLSLTIAGLQKRDEFVIRTCKTAGVPLVTTLSGGYAERTEDTVEIHCNTLRTVADLFG